MEALEKEEEQKHNLKSWGDLGGWKGPYLPLYKLVFKALRLHIISPSLLCPSEVNRSYAHFRKGNCSGLATCVSSKPVSSEVTHKSGELTPSV